MDLPVLPIYSNIRQPLLFYKIAHMSEVYVIKSSDWVNDFQDGLGLGRFLVVEVPLPELTNIASTSPSNEEKILRERLEAYLHLLNHISLFSVI
jgi:hypothetical protein